jgi:Na+/H+ antiporter NhaD/arsenite permease-like protein
MHPIIAAALPEPHPAMMLPFVLLLLAIALMPFINGKWWHHHYAKVAVALGAITAAYYLWVLDAPGRLGHVAHEYFSFLALVGSLFVVAGGIHIRVKGEATPSVNCLFLLVGALLANVIGTTGASMLLIRPWIRMNKYRITAYHIVFFIFIVSNVGGCLTPIGDPPLFLGYLKGVPFWWVLQKCWPAWAVCVFLLVLAFYIIDQGNFLRAPRRVREAQTESETWRMSGGMNLIFLGLILGAVFLRQPPGLSEALMVLAAAGSYWTTPKSVHEANDFNFGPIREVAWLFLGIFATMVPALDYLQLHARELGLSSPMQFYWLAGSLSSVLDNAPTYLAFLAAAMGLQGLNLDNPEHILQLAATQEVQLVAISLGAVFFGAMTYIGNGPNFMVKAIAEQAQVKTPDFLSYVFKYAAPILLPILGVVGFLFFSRWRVF